MRLRRKQFAGRTAIASHQLVQEKLVWMVTEISKAQLLALHIGRLKDRGQAQTAQISLLKMNNVWMARESSAPGSGSARREWDREMTTA